MNLDSILDAIQNFRTTLDGWGMTSQVLILAGVASLLLLVLSLREILNWFLRIHNLRRDVQDLNAKLDRVLEILERPAVPVIIEASVPQNPAPKEPSQFRLDH